MGYLRGGVAAGGMYLPGGGLYPLGVYLAGEGGNCPRGGGCIPACTEAHPTVDRMTDACENITVTRNSYGFSIRKACYSFEWVLLIY